MNVGYPGFSWSIRAASFLFVVSIAILAGAVFGGVCVYFINGALTGSPTVDAGKNSIVASTAAPSPAQPASGSVASAVNAQGKPIRMIDPSLPAPAIKGTPTPTSPTTSPSETTSSTLPPSVPTPTAASRMNPGQPSADLSASVAAPPDVQPQGPPPNVQASSSAPAQTTPPAQLARMPWPDALSRAHPSDTPASTMETPGSATVQPTENKNRSSARIVSSFPSSESAQTDENKKSAWNAHITKKRVGVIRQTQPALTEANDPSSAARHHRIYDYFSDKDRDGENEGAKSFEATKMQPGAPPTSPADVRAQRVHRGELNGKPPVIIRRQDHESPEQEDSDESGDQTNARPRSVFPRQPSPAPSFLGLFGDVRSDD
jgi:hypothetical protein